MKQFALIVIMLALLAACAPTPTPVATPDVNATAGSLSGTMVAETLTAQPTNTLVPTNTLLPTETFTPLPTDTPTAAETPTVDQSLPSETPSPFATIDNSFNGAATPTIFTGTFAPGNLDGLEQAILRIENLTGQPEIIVTISGVTIPREVPVYISYKISGAMNVYIYTGNWQYQVEIPNKKFFSGSFRQTNKDKTTMAVYMQRVNVFGP